MYRGPSFLLQHAYTVHRAVIDLIAQEQFKPLWNTEFGATEKDNTLLPLIKHLIEGLRKSYEPFVPATETTQPTDTLITKVILGTFGYLPACDRYFIFGFKSEGFKYSYLNDRFILRAHGFCLAHLTILRAEQTNIAEKSGLRYPLMKLVDMYFWQIGYEQEAKSQAAKHEAI